MRMFYRDELEGTGFEVEVAVNGIKGIERALTGSFDLLVVNKKETETFDTDKLEYL